MGLERDASHGWDRLSTLREAVPARLGRGSTPRTLIGLALVHVVAVTIVAASGDLHIDDIRAQAYAAGRTLWPFVIESNATHLAPGARLIDWVMATHWPLQHWPAVVITTAISALFAWSCVRLAVRVFSATTPRVLAVSWALFTPSVIPTFAWFRQALTTMVGLALVLFIVSLTLDAARAGRTRPTWVAIALHLVALGFSERALVVPVVVIALLLVTSRKQPWRSRSTWTRLLVLLGPHVLINLAFLAGYLRGSYDKGQGGEPGLSDAVIKLARWFSVDLLPGLLGGPVQWREGNGPYSFADTPGWLIVVALISAVLLVGAVVRRPGGLRTAAPVLVVGAAYAVPILVMIYVWRLARVSNVAATDDLRLLPDVVVATGFCVAALIGALVDGRAGRAASQRSSGRVTMVGAACLAVLAVGNCAVSWVGFTHRWRNTPVTGYLSAMRGDLERTQGQVLPTPVPDTIIPGWVEPDFTTGPLITLINPGALRDTLEGEAAVVSDAGTLKPVVRGRVGAAAVPEGFCGLVLPARTQRARLVLTADAPYYRGSIVVVGLLVGDATRVNVSVESRDGHTSGPLITTPSELLRGPHRIQTLVPYGVAVRVIDIMVETPNVSGVCVTSAQVDTVRASP